MEVPGEVKWEVQGSVGCCAAWYGKVGLLSPLVLRCSSLGVTKLQTSWSCGEMFVFPPGIIC